MAHEGQPKPAPVEAVKLTTDYPRTAEQLHLQEGTMVAVVRIVRGVLSIQGAPGHYYNSGTYTTISPEETKPGDYLAAQVGRVIGRDAQGGTIVEPLRDNEGNISEYDVSLLERGFGRFSLMPQLRWPNELTSDESFSVLDGSSQFVALSHQEDGTFVGRMRLGQKRGLLPPRTITIATLPEGYDAELSHGDLRLLIPGRKVRRGIIMQSTLEK